VPALRIDRACHAARSMAVAVLRLAFARGPDETNLKEQAT
jgi:hypothetical protein